MNVKFRISVSIMAIIVKKLINRRHITTIIIAYVLMGTELRSSEGIHPLSHERASPTFNVIWTGAVSDNWLEPENWEPAGNPEWGDAVGIFQEGPAILADGEASATHLTVFDDGRLEILGVGRLVTNWADIGLSEGPVAEIKVSGEDSFWTNHNHLVVGFNHGRGSLVIEKGGRVETRRLWLGGGSESVGEVRVTGLGSALVVTDGVQMGGSHSGSLGAAGHLSISDGGRMSSSSGIVGSLPGATSTVEVTGSGSLWETAGALSLSGSAEGAAVVDIVDGGGIITGEDASGAGGYVGKGGFARGEGVLNLSGAGSFWSSAGDIYVGDEGFGILSISNGARFKAGQADNLRTTRLGLGNNEDGRDAGILNIGKGGAPGILHAAAVHGGEGDATLNFNHNATAHRFENSEANPVLITGSTKVNHLGSGTTILGGENTYTGDTTITNGALVVNGSAANSAFTVDSGGTLGGFGTVGKLSLGSGGFLSPGESAGTLHVAGDFSWTAGGVVVFELGPDAAGSDFIEVAGEFLKDGDGEWAFDFVAANWIVGHTYDLAEFLQTDFEVGDFSFRNPGPFDGAFALEENRLRFTLTEVPEPSAYGLLFSLTAGAVLLFRRHSGGRRGKWEGR